MLNSLKIKLKNFIINSLMNSDDETKYKLYNSLFAGSLRFTQENYRKKYSIDRDFRFNGVNIFFYGEGSIILGKDSYIGDYSTIQSEKGATVSIGKKCSLSHNVRIYTSSNISDQDFSAADLKAKIDNVFIGDYVWIGANVFINPGVRIGNNAIVGANSVVVSDIPENSIYGGVPARLIRMKSVKENSDKC